jgi:polysaccharide biosynthesis protein PslH
MAMGKAVVSMTIGAERLVHTPGENCPVADDASSFAEAVVNLLVDPQLRGQSAESAHRLVHDGFSSETVARQFESIRLGALQRLAPRAVSV